MKLKAKDVRTCNRWILFNDLYFLKLTYLPRERCYLAVLYDSDSKSSYGWHQIPHSCMRIPTECHDWHVAKWAVAQHAKLHLGIRKDSDTV